ncbi:MAG: general secretion pathway protein E [Pseudomonadales bacterium]|jgi:general secretion pathway protein E
MNSPAKPQKMNSIPIQWAKRFDIVVNTLDQQPCVSYSDKTPIAALAEVRRFLDKSIKLELLSQEDIAKLTYETYEDTKSKEFADANTLSGNEGLSDALLDIGNKVDLLDSEDAAPVIRLVNAMLVEALKRRASDIHIDTSKDKLTIRYRVDGVLQSAASVHRSIGHLLLSRIKVMSKMDIAEKRKPQDGRFSMQLLGTDMDVRVSSLPTKRSERIVMRLLAHGANNYELTNLGMDAQLLGSIKKLIAQPHGIILVTGPTGSGKTTTLYAALQSIDMLRRNILTIEDPIEYDIEGISQTQVNEKSGMTFASGLRSMLRQDPDVILIGEIRDNETASIGVQASLTGHLVLSTLHTNTAVGAITRLTNMGVESYLLASSLSAVMAQRLVRKLCDNCKIIRPITVHEIDIFNTYKLKPPQELAHPEGCAECNNTGFYGRSAVYELVIIDDKLKHLITKAESEQVIAQQLPNDHRSLVTSGLEKVSNLETNIEEVLRLAVEQPND